MISGRIVKILGKNSCNECDCGERSLLITVDGNIYSRCNKCGFAEWEWTMGDSLDYLRYLADMYSVDFNELLRYLGIIRFP